tara:strand:+ start:1263 stop:1454 length:192 start_codon:yes stop_codon:yes gene_type:complete
MIDLKHRKELKKVSLYIELSVGNVMLIIMADLTEVNSVKDSSILSLKRIHVRIVVLYLNTLVS